MPKERESSKVTHSGMKSYMVAQCFKEIHGENLCGLKKKVFRIYQLNAGEKLSPKVYASCKERKKERIRFLLGVDFYIK